MRTKRLPQLVGLLALAASVSCQGPAPPATGTKSPEAALASPPPGSVYQGDAFTFRKIKEGIYHAVGTGNLAVGCNGAVIVNRDDVLIVDSHISPAAAWALLKEIKNITDKPVRYVVDTHFHFDHANGNQVFPPDVEVIGHEFTREKIASGGSKSGRSYDLYVGGLPAQIEKLEAELKVAKDASDDAQVKELEKTLAVDMQYKEATDAVVPTPPDITLSQRMTLYRGGREIELLFFGRGHTGGDVVVYLPEERVLATGDLITAGLSYMGDGYPSEWPDTLEEVKKLDFEWVLPGHGDAFQGKEKFDYFQAYLRDFWAKVQKMHADGVNAADAAQKMDMTNHAAHYPSIKGPGVNPQAVDRAYGLIEGTEQ